jgi:predicted dehydrogenase
VEKEYRVRLLYADYRKAVKENSDIRAAFICTPSSFHVLPAIFLAKNGIHLFIEKPLSHNLRGVPLLQRIVREKRLISMMGMCYRFHPGLAIVKALLQRRALGRVYSARTYGGHYLPDWHPTEDYRSVPYARRSCGGGVLLTSIHGYDYIRWLFGEAKEVFFYVEKVSALDIDVEDIVVGVLKTRGGVIVSSYSDFLQRHREHKMDIVCEKGDIRWDYDVNEVRVFDGTAKRWKSIKYRFQTNDMYVDEIRHFFYCVTHKKVDRDLDVGSGAETLKLVLSVSRSGRTGRIVKR